MNVCISCSRNLSYARTYIFYSFISTVSSINRVCVCSSLLALTLAQSRVSVCSLEQSTCYTYDWNRSNRSRNCMHIVLIGREEYFLSLINISHPCTRIWSKSFSMRSIVSVNLDVLEWASMHMNVLPFLNPFFFVLIATRPIRVK
jgi:hypothetical protein